MFDTSEFTGKKMDGNYILLVPEIQDFRVSVTIVAESEK